MSRQASSTSKGSFKDRTRYRVKKKEEKKRAPPQVHFKDKNLKIRIKKNTFLDLLSDDGVDISQNIYIIHTKPNQITI